MRAFAVASGLPSTSGTVVRLKHGGRGGSSPGTPTRMGNTADEEIGTELPTMTEMIGVSGVKRHFNAVCAASPNRRLLSGNVGGIGLTGSGSRGQFAPVSSRRISVL